jgi:hypothetical protein
MRVGTYKFVYPLLLSLAYLLCVGVKQGVRQMNIHLHIIAARVLNNFGVKGMYREEQGERAWRMRLFWCCRRKEHVVGMRLFGRLSSCISRK